MSASRALARVNLAAIERNCGLLASKLAEGCELCAVVKADGYGHGGVAAAHAALAGGAGWLAVATANEAIELRQAGLHRPRVLVMGALTRRELEAALAADADLVVWREEHVEAVAGAEPLPGRRGGRVHVKLDTGMGRLGTRDPGQAARVAAAARRSPHVELAGLMTHFATADVLEDGGFFEGQLEAFSQFAGELSAEHPQLLVHAANSAATLRSRSSHFDMVRCGIAVYGMDPFGEDALAHGLEPALELRSHLAEVKRAAMGESAGYGRRFVAARDTWVGVLPLGYGDGFRRGLSGNADVLVGGRRHPQVGTVSMDNITVDLGGDPASEHLRGEEAVLLGPQGSERITAEELAARLQTINYEITCGISARVPRRYRQDELPVSLVHPELVHWLDRGPTA